MANRSKHTEENCIFVLFITTDATENADRNERFSALWKYMCVYIYVCMHIFMQFKYRNKDLQPSFYPEEVFCKVSEQRSAWKPSHPNSHGIRDCNTAPQKPRGCHRQSCRQVQATLFYSKNACFIIKGQNKHPACSVKHSEVITGNPATWTFGILLVILQELLQERGKIITY